jgi:hypothetical protein
MSTQKLKSDDEIRQTLQNASTPEPIGGHEATRERVMGKVRHQFPVGSDAKHSSSNPISRFIRPLIRPVSAGAVVAGLALVVFFAWPQESTEADMLPSDTQMQQFYDQHEINHIAHFQEIEQPEAGGGE